MTAAAPTRAAAHTRPALAAQLAFAVMDLARRTPLRGFGGYGSMPGQALESDPSRRFSQAFTERDGAPWFYVHFPELPAALAGKRVLDFGCGYGGKALAYAEHAAFVAGVETSDRHVSPCEAYRQWAAADNVEFRLCTQDRIPYPDASFDAVVSHDVLEHVADPSVSLAEIARVLKPGGTAYLVFPTYDGALSHHLDYVCHVPALHWIFSPAMLVAAANRAIETWPIANIHRQPEPKLSWDGRRRVLPTLNGLTGPQFERLTRASFADVRVRYETIGANRRRHRASAQALWIALKPFSLLGPWVRDRVTGSIAATLTTRA